MRAASFRSLGESEFIKPHVYVSLALFTLAFLSGWCLTQIQADTPAKHRGRIISSFVSFVFAESVVYQEGKKILSSNARRRDKPVGEQE